MGDSANPSGGAQGGSGGAAPTGDSTGTQTQTDNSSGNPKTVSWENHQRALNDLHKFKGQVQELQTKLGDLESDRLKEKNDYKSLYETEKAKREESDKKLKEFSGWAVQTQRFNAVKQEALASGLRKEALGDLELVDLDDVKVETTSTGRFVVEGAKDRVEKLKTERPHWFTVGPPPTVNSGGGGTPPPTGGKLTANDVANAERDWKRGKITRQQYEETYKRYAKENPRYAVSGNPPPNRA